MPSFRSLYIGSCGKGKKREEGETHRLDVLEDIEGQAAISEGIEKYKTKEKERRRDLEGTLKKIFAEECIDWRTILSKVSED